MNCVFIRHTAIFLTSLTLYACANDGRSTGEHVDAAIEASGKAVQTAGEATIDGLRKVDQAISEAVEPDHNTCKEKNNANC